MFPVVGLGAKASRKQLVVNGIVLPGVDAGPNSESGPVDPAGSIVDVMADPPSL